MHFITAAMKILIPSFLAVVFVLACTAHARVEIPLFLQGEASIATQNHLTAQELSELSALYLSLNPEFKKLEDIAASHGFHIATYGGTSREIIEKVILLVREHGSAEKVREYLKKVGFVSYLDWHRIGSDLDIMLIAIDAKAKSKNESARHLIEKKITEQFPSNSFYKTIDTTFADEFFIKFSPAAEHFEATSNIPISLRGFEYLPQLKVQVNNQTRDLVSWGVQQYLTGRFQFAINEDRMNHLDAYANARQLLRWIRYLCAEPAMGITKEALTAISTLMDHILTNQKPQLIRLLRNDSLNAKQYDLSNKLLEALEKLQLNTKDSVRTMQILEFFKLADVIREAGVAPARLLKALPFRSNTDHERAKHLKPRGGDPLILRHRTSLVAAQNISNGALWMSDNQTVIGKKTTTAIQGAAIYAAANADSLSYGDVYVSLVLSPTAVPGVDYTEDHGYFAIKTREAIATDYRGHLMIEKLNRKTLLLNQMQVLEESNISSFEKASIANAVAMLVQPHLHTSEEELTVRYLTLLTKQNLTESSRRLFERPEILIYLMSPQAKYEIYEFYLNLSWTVDDAYNVLDLLGKNSQGRQRADMGRWIEKALQLALMKNSKGEDQHYKIFSRPDILFTLQTHFPQEWKSFTNQMMQQKYKRYESNWNTYFGDETRITLSTEILDSAFSGKMTTDNYEFYLGSAWTYDSALLFFEYLSNNRKYLKHPDVQTWARTAGLSLKTRPYVFAAGLDALQERRDLATFVIIHFRNIWEDLTSEKKKVTSTNGPFHRWVITPLKQTQQSLKHITPWGKIELQLKEQLHFEIEKKQLLIIRIKTPNPFIESVKHYNQWSQPIYRYLFEIWNALDLNLEKRVYTLFTGMREVQEFEDLLISAPTLSNEWQQKLFTVFRQTMKMPVFLRATYVLLNRVDPPELLMETWRVRALSTGPKNVQQIISALKKRPLPKFSMSDSYKQRLSAQLLQARGLEAELLKTILELNSCEKVLVPQDSI